MVVLVSEHSQVSEINAAVKIVGKKLSGICRAAKAAGEFVFRDFENVPRPILPQLHFGAHCACVCHFPCAYATSVNIRYAYVYACVYSSIAV